MTAHPRAATSDLALERSLLGALIVHEGAWARVGSILRSEQFDNAQARGLFDVIAAVAERDGRISAMTVRAALELDEDGRSTWRNDAILALMDAAPGDLADVDALANALIEMWARRRAQQLGSWIDRESRQAYASPITLARDASVAFEEIVAAGRGTQARSSYLGNAARTCLDKAEEGKEAGITTGLVDLDRFLGGYVPGRLIVVAGRPGMGKSTIAPSSARMTARTGRGVLYVSLEMTEDELAARLISDEAWSLDRAIPYELIMRRQLESWQVRRLRDVASEMDRLPFVIEDQAGVTVQEIGGRARRLAQDMAAKGTPLGLIVVDHIQLIATDGRNYGNAARELGEVSKGLKRLAKDLGVCVVALCQLNRGVEGREDKRPNLSDLRQSGEIEEDADQVLLLYREAYYLAKRNEGDHERETARVERLAQTQNLLEVLIEKNRHGRVGRVPLWVDMGSSAVRNASLGGFQ